MAYRYPVKKRILAVFAHPDDETFMAGGFMRAMADKNNDVFLFMATKGEKGGDPAVRVKELKKAARLLGIKKVYQAEFPDGELSSKKRSLEEELKQLIFKLEPHSIITFNSQGKDRVNSKSHPDHRTVSLVAEKLFRSFKKQGGSKSNLWPEELYLALPIFPSCRRQKNSINFDIRKYLKVKIEALKRHKSQGRGCWEVLGTDWSKYICPHESFVIKKQ